MTVVRVSTLEGTLGGEAKAALAESFTRTGEVETAGNPPRDYVWLSVHEVPDGAWGLNGGALRISAIEHLFSATRQGAIRRPVAERSR